MQIYSIQTVPPKSLIITQEAVPVTSVIGPFQEGDSTMLKCTAFGGEYYNLDYMFILVNSLSALPRSMNCNKSETTLLASSSLYNYSIKITLGKFFKMVRDEIIIFLSDIE